MRLMVDQYIGRTVSLGSPGIENIRWLKPVRAGDTLTYSAHRHRVARLRQPRGRRPGQAPLGSRQPAGETVLTMEGWGMFGRRPAA